MISRLYANISPTAAKSTESKEAAKKNRKPPPLLEQGEVVYFMAGAVGLEPTTNGFGDHYSTN